MPSNFLEFRKIKLLEIANLSVFVSRILHLVCFLLFKCKCMGLTFHNSEMRILHMTLTIKQKLAIVCEAEKTQKEEDLAKKYGISTKGMQKLEKEDFFCFINK